MNEKNLIDFCEVDFVEANKVINNGVLLINNPYNVVEKEETKPLIRTLKECRAIYDAYSVMSFPSSAGIVEDAIMVQTMNK